MDATNGDVSGVTATLPAGDANNDDALDIADFGLLVNNYGASGANRRIKRRAKGPSPVLLFGADTLMTRLRVQWETLESPPAYIAAVRREGSQIPAVIRDVLHLYENEQANRMSDIQQKCTGNAIYFGGRRALCLTNP